MVRRMARNWILFGTRICAESEAVTTICNMRMNQTKPKIQVIMRAVEHPSRCYSFLKDIDYVFLQPTTDLHAEKKKR